MENAEQSYFRMLELGATPQEARSVLPNSLKTEIVVTMNLRSWRNFFRLRVDSHAHPQMREVAMMLPIIVYCVRWGFGPGLVVSFAHAVLQTLFEGGIAIGWQSILGDFLIAYTVLGLAGLFKGKFYLATIVSCAARFLVHYVVGATIWAEYMPETFFNMTMTTPWIYSALYNAAYMLPDMLLILLVGAILMKTPAKKYLLGQDLG